MIPSLPVEVQKHIEEKGNSEFIASIATVHVVFDDEVVTLDFNFSEKKQIRKYNKISNLLEHNPEKHMKNLV